MSEETVGNLRPVSDEICFMKVQYGLGTRRKVLCITQPVPPQTASAIHHGLHGTRRTDEQLSSLQRGVRHDLGKSPAITPEYTHVLSPDRMWEHVYMVQQVQAFSEHPHLYICSGAEQNHRDRCMYMHVNKYFTCVYKYTLTCR